MMATPYFGYILSAYGVSAFALLALGWHSWINWRRSQLEPTADGMTDGGMTDDVSDQPGAEALPTQKEANPHEQG
ncbi:MAG: hypothetical protein ACK5WY_04315 [Holosporaceae bacterium]|jgi:hypothetical protein|nr:heme exporter protein CcmD [Rhodospirillaceae bacterium]